jgi:hypothetical protein
MRPEAGTLNAFSITSPLQVTSAVSPLTVITSSFQSWGLYYASVVYGPDNR